MTPINFLSLTPCGESCTACPKKINGWCKGCLETGGHCKEWSQQKVCPIFKCAQEHKVLFCGLCHEFPCQWLVETVVWQPNLIENHQELAKAYHKRKL